jgi:hypothetical protein
MSAGNDHAIFHPHSNMRSVSSRLRYADAKYFDRYNTVTC